MIPFSILDLPPITEDGDAAQSFRNTLDSPNTANAEAISAVGWPTITACQADESSGGGRSFVVTFTYDRNLRKLKLDLRL